MKRIIVLAALLIAGCDSEKKPTQPSKLPSAEDMFDKGKAPGGKGKVG